MATTLTFNRSHAYGDQARHGITIPVVLAVGAKQVRLLAKLDTGASFCIFERVYGEELGLNIEGGEEIRISTATEPFRAYGHEVTITSFDWTFGSVVYFPHEKRTSLVGAVGFNNFA